MKFEKDEINVPMALSVFRDGAYMIILMSVYIYGGWAHGQIVSTTSFTPKNSHVLLLLTGFEPRVIES